MSDLRVVRDRVPVKQHRRHSIDRAGPRAPAVLVVDAGDQQLGTAGHRLPRPFIATVTDDGFNRLGGVPVEFTVVKGEGHFGAGQSTIVVETDSDGRAVATLTLDPREGIANNAVAARIVGLPESPVASFTATGVAAGPAGATAITGVVLDNTSRPISGVTVRVDDTALWTTTDEAGQFRIEPAPVGDLLLIVDGSTTERPGVWASLEFRMTSIAGRENDLGMPIFLLPLDVASGLYVDEVTGGTVTAPDVPGLTLEVAPGSVTFPGGSKSGIVSITTVHSDRVPMVPNFGQQPRLIVTIQPAGARFDPPARITYPNVEGLAPGESTDLYSFDHDLGHFVSIGPGTVSDDGTVLVSDPGVGILKAGWHCGGDPQAAAGTAHQCGECEDCNGVSCVSDDSNTPEQRAPDDCQRQVCRDGGVSTKSDLSETPPVIEGNCREEICALGGPTLRTDLTDFPPGLACCGVPGALFIEPQIYDQETECCIEAEVLTKNPIADLRRCPGRVQHPGTEPESNGCSVPDSIEPPPGGANNPAGGADTQFSQFPSDNPLDDGPCDYHDFCYQRCNSSDSGHSDHQYRSLCDEQFCRDMRLVCERSQEAAEVVELCFFYAEAYCVAVSLRGSPAFEENQRRNCDCCP